jgi:hypothetical protein
MDNKIGRAFGMYKGRREVYKVLRKNLKERRHLEDLGIDGRIILKQTLKK